MGMSGFLRAVLLMLVGSLMLGGCTAGEGPNESVTETEAGSRDERDFVAGSSMQLPPKWSYNLSRQGADSWNFSLSPRPFNTGGRCDRNGPLAPKLLEQAEVFITGFAYVDDFPGAANTYKQTPGEFFLDDATLANNEGFCHPTYRMDFELDRYYVSVHVAVHRRAREATVDAALEALNSIRY
jgi:hypothetical protein